MPLSLFPGKSGTLLLVAVVSYLAILAFAYLRQDKLLYFPDVYPLAEGASRAKALGFRIWPENAAGYHGFVHAEGPPAPKGVILLFHGNAGTALDRSFYARQLAPLDFLLILFEYPGYGGRDGKPGEAVFVSAAVEAARVASGRFDVPLYLIGESLGCGVASAVAGSKRVPVAGVVLITPWNTLPDMAQAVFWYLPAKWITRDRYDNARNLKDYRGPVAVVAAERDEIIPPRLSARLFEQLSGRKKLWLIPGAGHNSWPAAVDSAWWDGVMRFVTAENAESGG